MEKNMNRSLVAFAALAMLLAGCASHQPQPEWTINGQSKAYPASEFLSGTGVAGTMKAARQRARDNLSKVFEIEVESSGGAKGHPMASKYANMGSVRGLFRSQAGQVMQGLRIAETWENPKTHVAHALAVLSRKKAASNLRTEILRLDETTDSYLQRSHSDRDVLHKIRDAQFAVDVQVARIAYEHSLRVIDPNNAGIARRWRMKDLNDNITGLLKLVRVQAVLPANSDQRLTQDVENALGAAGFLVQVGKSADFLLDTNLSLQDLGYQGNWNWVKAVLSVTLKERKSSVVRGSYQWTIKAAGTSATDARNRVMGQIGILLNRELRDVIMRIATH
jgi:hypothetical protein